MTEDIKKEIGNILIETQLLGKGFDYFAIKINELISSYQEPFIKYEKYDVNELKSYLDYKNAFCEIIPIIKKYDDYLKDLAIYIEQKYNIGDDKDE